MSPVQIDASELAALPKGIVPVDQAPGDGLCLQACLATLLGMPLDVMPRYDKNAKGHEIEFIEQRRQINRWLEREHGLTLVLITDFMDIDQCSDARMLAIASGPSPRQRGGHVCLVNVSKQIVHDPHPDRTGFKDGRIDALEVLVPLAPVYPASELAALREAKAAYDNLVALVEARRDYSILIGAFDDGVRVHAWTEGGRAIRKATEPTLASALSAAALAAKGAG